MFKERRSCVAGQSIISQDDIMMMGLSKSQDDDIMSSLMRVFL